MNESKVVVFSVLAPALACGGRPCGTVRDLRWIPREVGLTGQGWLLLQAVKSHRRGQAGGWLSVAQRFVSDEHLDAPCRLGRLPVCTSMQVQ